MEEIRRLDSIKSTGLGEEGGVPTVHGTNDQPMVAGTRFVPTGQEKQHPTDKYGWVFTCFCTVSRLVTVRNTIFCVCTIGSKGCKRTVESEGESFTGAHFSKPKLKLQGLLGGFI